MANLQSLGVEVAELSKALSLQLQAGKHPQPSFASDSPSNYPHDPAIQLTRLRLLEKARDLLYLATGPADFVFLEICLFVSYLCLSNPWE